MMNTTVLITILVIVCTLSYNNAVDQNIEEEEIRAQVLVNELNDEFVRRRSLEATAGWNHATNITDENEKIKTEIALDNAKYAKEKAKELLNLNFRSYKDDDLRRKIKFYSELGDTALPSEKFEELLKTVTAMETNYAKVHVCSYKDKSNCNLQLEPEITEILQKSDDLEELKYYWEQWHNLSGKPLRQNFTKYIELRNEAAKLNNFTSGAEMWLDRYEDSTFEQQLENIFDQIRPLYQQIHGYVRHQLRKKYGDIVSETGPIPMHLLGNMWAQQWGGVEKYTSPYPAKQSIDVTDEMIKQNYTPVKIFQMGDEFFQSLNMTKLPDSFWEKSVLEKPNDGRELVCHASAWDFYKDSDVRIKQCTRVNMDDFITAHHELGHIQYFLQYEHQPVVYRDAANPGIHEAVGDVLALSVSSVKHLKRIGLLKDFVYDSESKINQLYHVALEKIVFLPFSYTIDKYRWSIFRGEIKPDEYNCRFWKMREELSGIIPPVPRTEEDFDPAAKYHVSADVEYLRYLVSYILQFQFHKGACLKAGEYEPGNPEKLLSDCDIYQNSDAGNAIKAMLSLGLSKPWPDAIEVLTGQRKMEATALLEFFKPLQDWLEKTNKENNVHIGWDSEFKCTSNRNEF